MSPAKKREEEKNKPKKGEREREGEIEIGRWSALIYIVDVRDENDMRLTLLYFTCLETKLGAFCSKNNGLAVYLTFFVFKKQLFFSVLSINQSYIINRLFIVLVIFETRFFIFVPFSNFIPL